MKKFLFICLLGGLCLIGSNLKASNKVVDSPGKGGTREFPASSDSLTIGDRIPAGIEFSSVLHYHSDKLRLEDYTGKFTILQFWAPTCTASIGSLSYMDKLDIKYRDRIEVIPITTFAGNQVEKVFEGYNSLKDVQLPMVVNATKMRELFPHSTIPHFVILDPEGVVVAITGQEDLTSENLDLLLAGKESNFRYKVDKRIAIGRYDKLISESPQVPNKNIWHQSALTGYIPNVTGSLIQEFEDLFHIRIVNMPLYKLFQLAYSERDIIDYFGKNRIQTVGFDEEELFTDKTGADFREWQEEGNHVFGYELLAPPSKNLYALMREDLKRYFPNILASIVTEKRTVHALVQLEGKNYPKAIAGKRTYSAGPMGLSMRNSLLQGFIYHLNVYFYAASQYPILNLTGIDYPIDMDLNTQITSVPALREALQQIGLDLITQEQEIKVLRLEKMGETNLLNP